MIRTTNLIDSRMICTICAKSQINWFYFSRGVRAESENLAKFSFQLRCKLCSFYVLRVRLERQEWKFASQTAVGAKSISAPQNLVGKRKEIIACMCWMWKLSLHNRAGLSRVAERFLRVHKACFGKIKFSTAGRAFSQVGFHFRVGKVRTHVEKIGNLIK